MADAAVGFALQSLSSVIVSETKLISGISEDAKAIKRELDSIRSFLKGADQKAEEDGSMRDWVTEVRDLAYKIEDELEKYALFREENVWDKAKQLLSGEVRGMAGTMKSLRQEAVDVCRRESYSSRGGYSASSSEGGRPCSSCSQDAQSLISSLCSGSGSTIQECSELVGTEAPKKEIIEMLGLLELDLDGAVVAVVGMSGVGKTTVVGCVYNDREVRECFPVCAWVPVSRPYRMMDVLKSMVKQCCRAARATGQLNSGMGDCTDEASLIQSLKCYLADKRYMVVFDDVGEGDASLLEYVTAALPNNRKGSRILMTTRYENVASAAWVQGGYRRLPPYRLQPLPRHKARELFYKKAFGSSGGDCPRWLRHKADAFIDKCQGLPLAILGIGRLLSTKQDSLDEWELVYHSFGFYLQTSSHLTGISKFLVHSYHDLPSYLKPCFLYFGLFPKDHVIERMRLIRLWVAEGFVSAPSGSNNYQTVEDIADEYLDQLVSRSLIQVHSRYPTGRCRSFRVHDLLCRLILEKLRDPMFCAALSRAGSRVDGQPRRLSIRKDYYCSESSVLDSISSGNPDIRTVLLLIGAVQDTKPTKVLSSRFMESAVLLRILDLQNASIGNLPDAIGELRNLRYLSLRNTGVAALPRSIGKLRNLQTLDLKSTRVHELPSEIGRLHKLRHLLVYAYITDPSLGRHTTRIGGVKVPRGALESLSELQKLAFLDVGRDASRVLDELKSSTQLRRLGVVNLHTQDGRRLCGAVQGMRRLQSLNVTSRTKDEEIDLSLVHRGLPSLQRLYLNGRLRALPPWIAGELSSLVKVRLRWSGLDTDPFETLKRLPNLVEVTLLEAFKGEVLIIENTTGFKKLKILHLLDLHSLETMWISQGALPALEELSVGGAPRLQVPPGLRSLGNLRLLQFYDMPSAFTQSIRPGEQYYNLVHHVPDVYVYEYKDEQGRWMIYTLR